MASTMKVILAIALTMALSLTITMRTLVEETEEKLPLERMDPPKASDVSANIALPSKRLSRFLADTKNPRAPDQCNKDGDKCSAMGTNSTCCNNKCVQLSSDVNNCGKCKKECKFTYSCCSGECVDSKYHGSHCGGCGKQCHRDAFCFFGMCNYN